MNRKGPYRRLFLFLAMGGILFCLCGGVKHPKIRIGCLPVIDESSEAAVVLADAFHEALSESHTSEIQTIPLDWSFQALDADSARYPDYLLDYGKKLHLDYTIILSADSLSGSKSIVRWTIHSLKGSPVVAEDTVLFPDAGTTIHRVCDVLSRMTVGGSFSESTTPAFPYWKTVGAIRLALLTGDRGSAERMFDSIRPRMQEDVGLCLLDADIQIAKRMQTGSNPELTKIRTQLTRLPDTLSSRNLRLAQIDVLDERWSGAEDALHRILDAYPDNAEALFWLTRLHPARYKAFGFSSREQILKKVIALNPACEKVRLALAESFFLQHRFSKAEDCYRRLLAIHPRSLDGLMAWGKLAMVTHDFPEVIRLYEKIIDIDPANGNAFYNLGIVYYHDGQTRLAGQFFQKAVDLNDHADAHYYLGVIYEATGEREKAITEFRTRIRLRTGPDDVFAEEARSHLVELLYEVEGAPVHE